MRLMVWNDDYDDDDESNGHKVNNGMNRTKVFPEEVVTAAMLLPGSYPDLLGMQDDDGHHRHHHHHHHHCHHRHHHNHLDVEVVTGAMLPP